MQLRLLAERGAHEQRPRRRRARRDGRATAASHRCTRWRSRPPRGCCSPRAHRQQAQRAAASSSTQVPDIRADPYYAAVLARARAHRARPRRARARRPARRRRRAASRRSPSTRSAACPRPARRSRRRPRRGRRPVRRGGRALARVRQRPRARLRPARPGPLPGRARRARGARSRCARRASCSRRWATGRRSPRRKRCSSERPPPLRRGSFTKRVAPGGVEPPRADSKFQGNGCPQFYSALLGALRFSQFCRISAVRDTVGDTVCRLCCQLPQQSEATTAPPGRPSPTATSRGTSQTD